MFERDVMLIAETATPADMGWTLGVIAALSSAVGGLLTMLGKIIIEYRKAADAGELSLVQAKQVGFSEKLALVEERSIVLTSRVDECEDKHKECEDRCSTLEGNIKALQIEIARDSSDTLKLAQQHGEASVRMDNIEKRQG